jgi:hypothetical protein
MITREDEGGINKRIKARRRWLTPVILATQEAELAIFLTVVTLVPCPGLDE